MKRGEIYVVDLGPGVGREPNDVCPVVVVSNDVNNLTPMFVAVLPAVVVTDALAPLGRIVTGAESGYSTDVAVISMCPRSLDATRFTSGPVGVVPLATMQLLDFALQTFLELLKVPYPPRP